MGNLSHSSIGFCPALSHSSNCLSSCFKRLGLQSTKGELVTYVSMDKSYIYSGIHNY
jgi:hypothetical protein